MTPTVCKEFTNISQSAFSRKKSPPTSSDWMGIQDSDGHELGKRIFRSEITIVKEVFS